MQTGLASECAVVAQKHYMLDEIPVAFVIPSGAGNEQDRNAILIVVGLILLTSRCLVMSCLVTSYQGRRW